MKSLLLSALVLLTTPLFCSADLITIGWTTNSPPPAYYSLYWGTNSWSYGTFSNTPGSSVTLDLPESQKYFFVVTATDTNGIESGPSNEIISWVVSTNMVTPPYASFVGTPSFCIESTTNLLGQWSQFTEWFPILTQQFFRVKIQTR